MKGGPIRGFCERSCHGGGAVKGVPWSTSDDIGQQAGGTHPTGMHSSFNSGSF